MTLVVDANVAVKWYVPQTDRAKALQVQRYAGSSLAPSLIFVEVANALWRHVKATEITAAAAEAAVAALPGSFSEIVADGATVEDALKLSLILNHSPDDCIYLALAEQRGATLVTADQAFYAKLVTARRTNNVALLHQWNP